MRWPVCVATLALLLLVPQPASAQVDATTADSAAMAAAGQEAGVQAGRNASVQVPIWGSAAATFFLTPFVGGLGSLIVSHASVPAAPAIRTPAAEPQSAVYQQAYTAGYHATYGPRYRRAVTRSVLITSVVFFGSMFALAG